MSAAHPSSDRVVHAGEAVARLRLRRKIDRGRLARYVGSTLVLALPGIACAAVAVGLARAGVDLFAVQSFSFIAIVLAALMASF